MCCNIPHYAFLCVSFTYLYATFYNCFVTILFFFVKEYVKYCTVVNVHENLIFDNIKEFLALQIQSH